MISVIIPTYNHGRALLKCLASLQAQAYTDWEAIVVDDGSTDGTDQIVTNYLSELNQSTLAKIRYLKQAQAGAPAARNAGAAVARGDYYLFSDADIIWRSDALVKLEKALSDNQAASFVYSNFNFGGRAFKGRPFHQAVLADNNYIHTSALLRAAHFPGFDIRLKRFQDWDLWLTMVEQGHQGIWLDEFLFSASVTRPGISKWYPRAWYWLWNKWPSLAPPSWLNYQAAKQIILSKHQSTNSASKTSKSSDGIDVSVIIVSWNSQDYIKKCLESVRQAALTSKFAIETIIVDNGSIDDSLNLVREFYPEVLIVANKYNLGFGRACNQGATLASGRHLFFLNPDTEVLETSLDELIALADNQPNVGIIGPQLINDDDSIQPSCRRWPSFLALSLDLLKLQTVWPNLKSISKYRMTAFKHETMRQVEQVMGAALFVRKETFREVGGFDTNFFIWFEDADFCKMVADKGWMVMFYPTAKIKHSLSLSFKTTNRFWRQWQFAKSARYYANKHWSILPAFFINLISFIGLPLAAFGGRRNFKNEPRSAVSTDTFGRQLVWLFIGLDLLSLLAHYVPSLHNLLFLAVMASFAWLAIYKFQWAVLLAIAELIIGSHGYLFSWQSLNLGLSLRQGLFSICLVGGLALYVRQSPRPKLKNFWPVVLLSVVTIWGVALGLLNNNEFGDIIKDGNGFIYILLAFPILLVAARDADFKNRLPKVLVIAGLYLAVKSLLVLYILTHAFGWFRTDLYVWLRDTRMAELTPTSTGAYRVFLPSQIWLMFIWLIALVGSSKKRLGLSILGVLSATGLLISFSRSFWLAWFIITALFVVYVAVSREFQRALRSVIFAGSNIIAALALITAILIFPVPTSTSSGDLAIQERFDLTTEAAASSRWKLLDPLLNSIDGHWWLGRGFGTPVTYISDDPRVRSQFADGVYTTTAFEWGYLDMIQEFGLIGLGLFIIALGLAIYAVYRRELEVKTRVVFILSLIGFMFVHASTPFLDHPIGLGLVATIIGLYASKEAVLTQSIDK